MIPLTQEEIAERMTFPGVYSLGSLAYAGTTTISYDFSETLSKSGVTLRAWDSEFITLSLEVMTAFEGMIDVDFVEMAEDATDRHISLGLASNITGAAGKGGYSWSGWGGNVDYNGWAASEDLSNDQSYRELFAHELGHAMGLQHSFSGNPPIPDAYEHEGFSIMSYTRDPGPTLENAYSGSWRILNSDELAILDVVALQAIWGAKLDGNMGDTTYGTTTAMTRTIVDGGGNDTIDLGDWQTDKMDAIIDLGRGGLSEVGRDTSGTPEFLRFAIDYNSDIENLIAPATPETNVTGNDLANSIMATEVFGEGGFAAADHFEGLGGNDTLSGFTGDDTLWGGADDDELFGGSGSDTLMGNEGADVLDGGTGADLLAGDAMSLQEVWDELAAAGMAIA